MHLAGHICSQTELTALLNLTLSHYLCSAVRADEANHRDVNHTFASLELDAEVSNYLDHSGRAMRQARELFKKKVILDIPSSQGASKGVSTSNA